MHAFVSLLSHVKLTSTLNTQLHPETASQTSIQSRKYIFARSQPEPLSPAPVVYDVQFEVKLKMAVALLSEMSHPHGDPNSGAHRTHKFCSVVY